MKKILSSAFIVFLLFSQTAQAKELEVWSNKDSGKYSSGFQLQLLTNIKNARIFWTKNADASPAQGLMYESPISIRRTTALWFFAFTPEPEISSTQFQKTLFFVESASGYEHLRISKINPRTKIITLKNYSDFPADLSGWILKSERGEYFFDNQELASGKTLEISLPMKSVVPRVALVAPDGNTKQIASLPLLENGEVWMCTTRRSSSCGITNKI